MKNILLILFTILCLKTNAQVGFISVNYPTNEVNKHMVCADFNNDGNVDIIVANSVLLSNDSLDVLLGNGLGVFGSPVSIGNIINVMNSSSLQHMIAGDFNSDGNADLALLIWGTPNRYIKVLFGDGTAHFPSYDTTHIAGYPVSICSSDINGDGNADFIIIGNGTMSVLLGDGAGNFVNSFDFVVGASMRSIVSADFNGDGNMDVAAPNNVGGGLDSVWIWLGNGSGSFATVAKYLAGFGPSSIASSDFDGDGFADIVVGNTNSNNVSVLISQGSNGLFSSAINYATGNQPWSVVNEDFNLDGIADIAVANYGNSLSVLIGTGTGSFDTALNYSAQSPTVIISKDFNEDGRPDLATANQSSSVITVFLNDPSVAVPITPSICLVTADSTNTYNVVVWEKENLNMTSVDSFLVYREMSTNNYGLIGFVLYDSLSIFNDYNANPASTAYRYKLKSKCALGIESVSLSNYHNTMYLTNNGANFSWTPYQIENNTTPVANYYIYRDDNSTGSFSNIGSTTGNQTGYTDVNFSSFPNASYYVEAVMANGACTPTRSVVSGSISNVIYFGTTGIAQSNKLPSINVFPNPINDVLNITRVGEKTTICFYNILGNLVLKENIDNSASINVNHLSTGSYILVIENETGKTFKRITISR